MKAMRKMMAVMLMGLAFSAAQVESSAQSRGNTDRKPAATTNHSKPVARPVRPDVKPGGNNSKPSGPATRPSGPANKPSGPAAKPSGPAHKPSGPAHKPGGPAHKPSGQHPRPNDGYRPAPRPGSRPAPRPGYRPAPRPPKRAPKPVIVVRPTYGTIIAASIANQLIRSTVRAASRPIYVTVESRGLSLSHSYISADTEYYYQDGVFYIIDGYGQYVTIIPPTGALVEYLPDDYIRFTRGGETYFRVDDTVYALTVVDGNPYFEVLGQM
jgi:hypothetical protein